MAARAVAEPQVVPGMTTMPDVMNCPKTPTPEVIAAVKQAAVESGLGDKIYKFELEDQTVIFRPLMRADWNEIQAFVADNRGQVTSEAVEQKVCEKAILWPQQILHPFNWERQRAGLQRNLFQYIQARSGFHDPELEQTAYLNFEPLYELEKGPKPDPSVVESLKAEYPTWPLKLAFIEGEYFVLRPFSRGEWRQLTSAGEDQDLDLLTAQRTVIWSKEYPEKPDFSSRMAFVCQTLASEAMRFSGFLTQATVEEL